MRMFLLKQIERLTTKTVENATTVFYKPSLYASSMIAIAAAVVMSPVYAGEKLSDAELDTKFIEVQIRQICTVESDDSKKTEDKTSTRKAAQYICRTDDLFVTAINKDGNPESKQIGSTSDQSADSEDSNSLLAGIIQNIRSFGRADLLGVPTGVSNTGNPLLFGSERYSYKWAGNLGDIFQPAYSGGILAPYSVYDYSSMGYGFREEAHIPYNITQPVIQSINTHN